MSSNFWSCLLLERGEKAQLRLLGRDLSYKQVFNSSSASSLTER